MFICASCHPENYSRCSCSYSASSLGRCDSCGQELTLTSCISSEPIRSPKAAVPAPAPAAIQPTPEAPAPVQEATEALLASGPTMEELKAQLEALRDPMGVAAKRIDDTKDYLEYAREKFMQAFDTQKAAYLEYNKLAKKFDELKAKIHTARMS